MKFIKKIHIVIASTFLCWVGYAHSEASVNSIVINKVTNSDSGSNFIELQGRVNPLLGITQLDINGYTTTLNGKTFTVSMPRANEYQINMYNANGEYTSVNYNDIKIPIDSAVQVVLGNTLMNDLGPALGRLLTDLDLNKVLGIEADECVIDTSWLIGCDFYLEELALHGTPTIKTFLSPVTGREELTINIRMSIPEAAISTKIKRALWWGYKESTITTNDIDLNFQFGVKATDDQSIQLILDEPSDVQLSIGKMHVDANHLAAHLVPLFKDGIARFINKNIVNITGPFLKLLPIPAIPITLPVDINGDNVNDAEFAINMKAQVLNVLNNKNGLAVLAGSISSSTVATGRDVIGTRIIGGNLPNPSALTSPTDISANVAVDLLNQVLTAVYQSGLEEKLSLALTVADLGDFGLILYNSFGYDLDAIINISLKFGAAPFALANNSSQYPLGLDAGLSQLQLQLSTPQPDGEEVIINFTSDILINTSLAADTNGSLHLEFGNLLTLNDTVINSGSLIDEFGFPPDILAFLVQAAVPSLVANLEPTIDELLNAVRLELDIGKTLGDWLDTTFPSLPVKASITETGVSDDESYVNIGVGIDFPQ